MNILSIFKEDNGNFSMARVMPFFVTAVILFNWTVVCVKTGTMAPLNWDLVVTILGLFTGKVVQKNLEK